MTFYAITDYDAEARMLHEQGMHWATHESASGNGAPNSPGTTRSPYAAAGRSWRC